jgi:hypothetical protein
MILSPKFPGQSGDESSLEYSREEGKLFPGNLPAVLRLVAHAQNFA